MRKLVPFFISYLKKSNVPFQEFGNYSLSTKSRIIRDALVSFINENTINSSCSIVDNDKRKHPVLIQYSNENIEIHNELNKKDIHNDQYEQNVQIEKHENQNGEQIKNENKRLMIHNTQSLSKNISTLYGSEFLDGTNLLELAEIAKLEITQLRRIINRGRQQLRDKSPKKITLKEKKILKDWIETNYLNHDLNHDLINNNYLSNQTIEDFKYTSQNKIFKNISKKSNKTHNSYFMLSHSQENELMEKTGLNKNQIYRQLQLLIEDRGIMTYDLKNNLSNWIKKNNRPPTQEERKLFLKETGWSTSQLNSYIHYLLNQNENKDSNHIALEEIKKWMNEYQRLPSKEEQNQFIEKFDLSYYDAKNMFRNSFESLYKGPPTSNYETILENWYNVHKKTPNIEEKKQLALETNLSLKSVYNYIYRLKQRQEQPQNKITQYSKDVIISWIKENNRLPDGFERKQLQLKTGLNQSQLYNQLYYTKNILQQKTN